VSEPIKPEIQSKLDELQELILKQAQNKALLVDLNQQACALRDKLHQAKQEASAIDDRVGEVAGEIIEVMGYRNPYDSDFYARI
jgi:hypothetical protein